MPGIPGIGAIGFSAGFFTGGLASTGFFAAVFVAVFCFVVAAAFSLDLRADVAFTEFTR